MNSNQPLSLPPPLPHHGASQFGFATGIVISTYGCAKKATTATTTFPRFLPQPLPQLEPYKCNVISSGARQSSNVV